MSNGTVRTRRIKAGFSLVELLNVIICLSSVFAAIAAYPWLLVGIVGILIAGVAVYFFVVVAQLLIREFSKWRYYPPFSFASSILQFVFTTRAYERVFATTLADGRQEYFECLQQGKKWRARWMLFAYHFILFEVIWGMAFAFTLGRLIKSIFGGDSDEDSEG